MLRVAVRVEPPTIAARSLDSGGVKTKTSARFFTAALELVDARGEPQPYLAESLPTFGTESWQVFPDGRMETRYRLRPNLTWHDGAPLTAEDFVFAWRVFATPELGQTTAPPVGAMEQVQAPDDRTVIIRWSQPYPHAAMLQETGAIRFPPLPRHILEAPYQEGQWEAFQAHPYWTREYLGAGPFRLTQWTSGDSIEGAAFDGHALGRPKIDRLRITFIGDGNTGIASLLAGAVDLAADDAVDFSQGMTAKREWAPRNGGDMVVTTDVWRAVHAQFRPEYMRPSAVGDVRVRRALAYAIDKQALNDTLFEGQGVMADSIFPSNLSYYPAVDQAIAKYPHDPRRVEQLMAEAGYARDAEGSFAHPADGRFSPELKTNASTSNELERSIIAAGWRAAGFDVQEATVSVAQARNLETRATYRAFYTYGRSLGEYALPMFLGTELAAPENRWTGNNRGGWANAEYDRLVGTLNVALDPNERVRLIAQVARVLNDELPAMSLYYDLGAVVFTSAAKGPGPVSPEATGLVSWNVHTWEMH